MAQNPNPSLLDAGQIIKRAFDGDEDRIRVDAEVTANFSAAQEVIISDVDDSIKIGNGSGTYAEVTGTNALKVDGSAVTQPVSVNNAAGASAVNIQDGGNSITVDGTVTANQGGAPWSNNITQFGSNPVVTGVGNSGLGIPRVTVASDSNIITVASNTIVAVTNVATTALAANTSRKYAYIYNQSGSTIFIKLGAAAVTGEGIRLVNNSMYEITQTNLWTGTVSLIKVGAASVNVDVFEGT